jgi:hypothetical protein
MHNGSHSKSKSGSMHNGSTTHGSGTMTPDTTTSGSAQPSKSVPATGAGK